MDKSTGSPTVTTTSVEPEAPREAIQSIVQVPTVLPQYTSQNYQPNQSLQYMSNLLPMPNLGYLMHQQLLEELRFFHQI